MKISKMIKGIMNIGAVSGIAYLAYRCGEYDGQSKVRPAADDEENINFYDDAPDYDEPDEDCLAPAHKTETCVMDELPDPPEKPGFKPLSDIHIQGIRRKELRGLLLHLLLRKSFPQKDVADYLGVDKAKAAEVIVAFIDAGYVVNGSNWKYRCVLNLTDYAEVVGTV